MNLKSALLIAATLAWGHAAQAAEWTVDAGKSKLGFVGSQAGSPFDGRFTAWTARIDFDPANPAAGKASVEIDMASAVTGDRQKDESLPQAEWFDAKSVPKARFEATGFTPKGGNAFEARGTLSIRGVTKDVTLPFTLDITGTDAHAVGRLPLVRTDYGVGQGAWKAGDMVALEVAVTVDIRATRKP